MDFKEVEEVVQNFFDADYARDVSRLDTIFLEGSEFFGFDNNGRLIRKTGKEFVNGFRNTDSNHLDYPKYNEIISLDFASENTAVVRTKMRVRNTMYSDILCLMNIEGTWGIVAKIASGVPIEN